MEYILGILVSLIVQFAKKYIKKGETFLTLLLVFCLSIIAAASYVLFVHTNLWPVFAEILITAGAFYAFIIKRFESVV